MAELTNNVVSKTEKPMDWETTCSLFARIVWQMGERDINNIDVKGFRGEVVNAVGLHGLHKVNEILDEYYDIWEESIDDD